MRPLQATQEATLRAQIAAILADELHAPETKQTRPNLTLIQSSERSNTMEQPTAQHTDTEPRDGVFYDLDAAHGALSLGVAALKGIGVMLQPEFSPADEQMNLTRRSDASAVFQFFSESMRVHLQTIADATARLEFRR